MTLSSRRVLKFGSVFCFLPHNKRGGLISMLKIIQTGEEADMDGAANAGLEQNSEWAKAKHSHRGRKVADF